MSVILLWLFACGGEKKDSIIESSPSPLAVSVPEPTSTSEPTQEPTATPSPLVQSRSSQLNESEILHKFDGQKSMTTEAFSTHKPWKVIITHKGGPISVNLIEGDSSPRDIYSGPSTNASEYKSKTIISPGNYSLAITCPENCEWLIVIEADNTTASSVTSVAFPTKTTSQKISDTPEAKSSVIAETEWDMFDAEKASIILSAPNARAITLEFDSINMNVNVTGFARSVPAKAHVMVANLELGDFVVVAADDYGAFRAKVNGHPGTHVMIKQDVTRQLFHVEDPQATHNLNTLRTIFPPGILLRIPIQTSESGVPFSSGGRLPNDEDAPWTIEGNLDKVRLAPGQAVSISGQVTILTGQDTPPSTAQLLFYSRLLVNSRGRQVGGSRIFTTSLFTPTNLPIESKNLLEGSQSVGDSQLEWRFDGERWASNFSTTLTIDGDTHVGLYQLKANLSGVEGLPRSETQNVLRRSFMQHATIGTLTIGQPAAMHLTSTLLADELSEGSRGGVLAREDQGLFDISHRAGVRHQPVIPRLDNYGKQWNYRLEPYMPLLGVVDRSPPAAPSIELDLSTSELTIKVLRPNGLTDTLGPAPLTSYTIKSPRTPWHKTVSEDGGNVGEVPQLQNDANRFSYKFASDGDYVVTIEGHISDFTGQIYAITGTYDVTVANILDIEASLLPGTPFEIGDSLPVGLRVMPGFPATIDYTVTHIAADGTTIKRTFTGNANENGWWDGNGEAFIFERDGEYRVDVEARYIDIKDALWVGRLRFGSAVATPDAPMILHGRRGPTRISEIAAAWGFSEDFEGTDADHIQFPYFSGDVLWGQENVWLGDSVVILTSIQLLDDQHPLIAKAIQQADDSAPGIPLKELIKVGQMPLNMTSRPGIAGNRTQPNDIDFWTYVYASAQRPGVRVREQILGDDIGGAYWRFDDAYHMQSGNGPQGDLPSDYKFLYAAAVIRDAELGHGVYAVYGSGWVLAHDDDPMGVRFMPPFQGAGGGPTGGPLFTVHGREIDIFFVPLGVRPGAVLEIGESFRMAGPIMPTLPSKVEYIVTAPNGTIRSFEGRANSVGYYYNPADDFELEQTGLWTVELSVTHDGMTSAGPLGLPYPTGGPLTPDGSSFNFVVIGPKTQVLSIETDLTKLTPAQWFSHVQKASFEAALPTGWSGSNARVIVSMPGNVLVDKKVSIIGDTVTWILDGQQLNHLANNFDYEQGFADTLDVTFYAEGNLSGKPIQASGTMVVHGARVPIAPTPISIGALTVQPSVTNLPELSSFATNKTDQFLVDMDYVKGGHPFKGQGSNNSDDGAHVEFDNSSNQWPEGTTVTAFPPIYAVADGYVERVNTYEPVGGGNHKYGVHVMFAQKDGRGVKFHISIEPSMDPGDSSFYEPFIMVKEGQFVRKGEILAYMYLEPNSNFPGPHIHFSVQPEGKRQQAPAIFTDEIVEAFHARWGNSGFDYKNSPAEGGVKMPLCMGYKLAAFENPFGATTSECLK